MFDGILKNLLILADIVWFFFTLSARSVILVRLELTCFSNDSNYSTDPSLLVPSLTLLAKQTFSEDFTR